MWNGVRLEDCKNNNENLLYKFRPSFHFFFGWLNDRAGQHGWTAKSAHEADALLFKRSYGL